MPENRKHSSIPTQPSPRDDRFLVIGGGIAGSTCAIEIKRLRPSSKVTLVCPTPMVKAARVVKQLTPYLGVVDVEERSADDFAMAHTDITLVSDAVTQVDAAQRHALLASGDTIAFARCCVATGATPVLAAVHPRVLGIRDMESVEKLSKRLVDAKRVLIVGNGGIALELVHALTSAEACQVVWAVRDDYIGNTFFDATASAFVLPTLSQLAKTPITAERAPAAQCATTNASEECEKSPSTQRLPSGHPDLTNRDGGTSPESHVAGVGFSESNPPDPGLSVEGLDCEAGVRNCQNVPGGGLGPDWVDALKMQERPAGAGGNEDCRKDEEETGRRKPCLDIQFSCELESIVGVRDRQDPSGESWPVWGRLTNGMVVGCDFVVSATGVTPNTDVLDANYERGRDGGLVVDKMMRVSRCTKSTASAGETHQGNDDEVDSAMSGENPREQTIFAAGDCCCLDWPTQESPHWFQMRLWSQARAMGLYAAKCMADCVDELGSAGAFDLFVHATHFFGHQVALLGHFNGQGLGRSVQDFMSRRLVVDDCVRVRHGLQGESTSLQSDERSRLKEGSRDLLQAGNAVGVSSGSSDVVDAVAVLVRMTPGVEYIKVVLEEGKVRGAMLIGNTGLEETFENLILNGTDVSQFGAELLNADVDIEDFFD